MFGLKSYVSVVFLMLCFVFCGTSATGGNCCCCCKKSGEREALLPRAVPKVYCSLCMEEITEENRIALDCFCKRCFDIEDMKFINDIYTLKSRAAESEDDLFEVIKEDPAPRLESQGSVVESKCVTPLRSRIDTVDPRSPSIKPTVAWERKEKLDIWISSQGITKSVRTFIKDKKECTRVTLALYISELLRKGSPIKIKQAYMPALLKLAMVSRNFTYSIAPTGKLSKPSEEDMWVSVMVEVSYRAFLNRIRLLVMIDTPPEALDPILRYIYITHKTPTTLSEKAYRFYIKRILFESGLGWPGFETREQAEEYLQELPPNQEVIEIKNGNTGETVAWVVGERFKHHKQLAIRKL